MPELHAQLAKGLGLEKAAYEAARVLFPEAPDDVVKAAADYAVFTFVTPGDHEMMAPNGRWLKLNHQDIGNGVIAGTGFDITDFKHCLLYTSPSPRDKRQSRMPSSA